MGHPVGNPFTKLSVDRLEVWKPEVTDKLLLKMEEAVTLELTLERTDVCIVERCIVERNDVADVRPVVPTNVGCATMGKDSRFFTEEVNPIDITAGVACVAMVDDFPLVKTESRVGYTVT